LIFLFTAFWVLRVYRAKGSFADPIAIWFLLFAAAFALTSIPGVQYIAFDDTGVLSRWAFVSKRVAWVEVTAISEHRRGGRGGGWGVLVAKWKAVCSFQTFSPSNGQS
jgi:hypothetical protein